jgi:hypothetical protein
MWSADSFRTAKQTDWKLAYTPPTTLASQNSTVLCLVSEEIPTLSRPALRNPGAMDKLKDKSMGSNY